MTKALDIDKLVKLIEEDINDGMSEDDRKVRISEINEEITVLRKEAVSLSNHNSLMRQPDWETYLREYVYNIINNKEFSEEI